MMKKILLYLTTALATLILSSQVAFTQGYRIEAAIKGVQDTSLILSYRYGQKFYTLDTAWTNNEGYAVFEDTSRIERGMYQIILPDKSFIDFFIDETSSISITSEKDNLINSLKAETNPGNKLFFEWQAKNQDLRKQAQVLQAKMEAAQKNSSETNTFQDDLALIRNENKLLWDNAINKLGNHLAGKFLKGMRPFEVPENIYKEADGKINQLAQYNYYTAHFFDDIDFTDPALIRTPLIHSKLDQFFNRVVPGIPDSVIVHARKVIERSESNPEMFQFVVQYLLNLYSEPKIMGMDAVYVFIAENYYLNGKANWVDEKNLNSIQTRVQALKPLLLGQPAPKLIGLETPEGEVIDIYNLDAKLIILYFWEPDCGFCKTATPKLMNVYKDFQDKGVKVIAINTRDEKEPWEKFIAEHELTWINVYPPLNILDALNKYDAFSTPKLFILDHDMKILAKDINVDQTPDVLNHFLNSK